MDINILLIPGQGQVHSKVVALSQVPIKSLQKNKHRISHLNAHPEEIPEPSTRAENKSKRVTLYWYAKKYIHNLQSFPYKYDSRKKQEKTNNLKRKLDNVNQSLTPHWEMEKLLM